MDQGFSYVATEDFNADQKADLLFQNSASHALSAWEMNGTQVALNQQLGIVDATSGWHLVT